MQGIELIKDRKGNITEIRVDVRENPDLAKDIYHLIGTLKRVKEIEKSPSSRQKIAYPAKSPMSVTAFNQRIRDAKASGEVSEESFFQKNPQWRKRERLS
ncbi:MAG: hypothetical protein SF052_11735 [Bacteroidia bacterium]|nr:hypothetical protein [Bacteroidia bacterium]